MLSVKLIPLKTLFLFACLSALMVLHAQAQENSPFSRHGLGDLFPNQSALYKAMGGMTAAQGNSLLLNNPNVGGTVSLNPNNPASFGFLKMAPGDLGGNVTYDLGILADLRTLKSVDPSLSYNSANFMPAYFTMAFPVSKSGMGVAFGLKPVTRISYDLKTPILFRNNIKDSIQYTGEGGINQAFLGVGKAFGNFRIGLNGGFNFGKKDFTTTILPYSDTFMINTGVKNLKTVYRGFTWDGGMQYTIKLKEATDAISKVRSNYNLDLGVSGSISQQLNGTKEEFIYAVTPSGADTISYVSGAKGKITLPMNVNGGFMLNHYLMGVQKYGFGAEYNTTSWSQYRGLDNKRDTALSDSWVLRAGGYFIPDPLRGTSMFSTARYSVGGYYGKDYINVGNTSPDGYNVMAITFGAGFNLRRQMYSTQSSMISTAFEIGKRGSSKNNVSENFYKISVGFSLSDNWFAKRKYD